MASGFGEEIASNWLAGVTMWKLRGIRSQSEGPYWMSKAVLV